MNQPHFSSLRPDWKTPKAVYQILDAEFHFDHDPCPPNFTVDGLTSEWGGSNFVNPPYNQLKAWLKKGYEEWQKGKTVVVLIPSRTDTIGWHDYCMKATEIRFIKGRLKFDDQPNPAPFPSAIVIFKASRSFNQVMEEYDTSVLEANGDHLYGSLSEIDRDGKLTAARSKLKRALGELTT